MKLKQTLLLPFLIFSLGVFAQTYSFSELESMIGNDFETAEKYVLQNSNWESHGEAETSKGIRLKYKNSKRDDPAVVFRLIDLYKSEQKQVLIAYSMQYKSSDVYHDYLEDLKSSGYEVANQIKEKGRYGRMYKKGKMNVITELKTTVDDEGVEQKTYTINISTSKKYK